MLQQPRQLQLRAIFVLKRIGILQSYLQIAAVFSGNRQNPAF
jgi:hypothetical protein